MTDAEKAERGCVMCGIRERCGKKSEAKIR